MRPVVNYLGRSRGSLVGRSVSQWRLVRRGLVTATTLWLCVAVVAAQVTASVENAGASSLSTSDATDAFSWGNNSSGQLGIAGIGTRTTPGSFSLPLGVAPRLMSAAEGYALATASNGDTYAWGDNGSGVLGDGTTAPHTAPSLVSVPASLVSISAGPDHALAVDADGTVYSWGLQSFGDLGDGVTPSLGVVSTPEPIALPNDVKATAVAAGYDHSLALGSDGKVYGWGHGPNGAVGVGAAPNQVDTPERIFLPGDISATAIAAGNEYSLAIGVDGNIYAWGQNAFAGLGDGTNSKRLSPVLVTLPDRAAAVAIAAGEFHSLAVDTSGQVYAWGWNQHGQIGDDSNTTRLSPELISLPLGVHALSVSAGVADSFAVGDDGSLYAWGANGDGQLGSSSEIDAGVPVTVGLPGGLTTVAVSAGSDFTLASGSSTASVPHFVIADPPGSAIAGQNLHYRFLAAGFPSPQFSLEPGAPPWLTIDPVTGLLQGLVPNNASDATYSVVVTNSAGTSTAGPFQLAIGAAVQVEGQVMGDQDSPIVGALVEACNDSLCSDATTQANGSYDLQWIANTEIVLTAYPPSSLRNLYLPRSESSATVPATGLTTEDIVLVDANPPPAAIDGVGLSASDTPIVNWTQPTSVSFSGCPDGLGMTTVVAPDRGRVGQLLSKVSYNDEAPADSGEYSAVIDPLMPLHGPAEVTTASLCPPPGGFDASSSAALTGRSARALAAGGASLAEQIAEYVYHYGWKAIGFNDKFNDLLALAMAKLDPSCENGIEALKAAVTLFIEPAVDDLAEAALPEVVAAEAAVLSLAEPAILIVAPLTALALKYVADQIAGQLASAAVDAQFGDICKDFNPNLLIDPSGTVLDMNGNPIPDATVLLLRSDQEAGPFSSVDSNSPGIEPPTNPETTAADGVFHWDVSSGFYRIQATAAGCAEPDDPSRTAVAIGPYPVPPPQVGLVLTMACVFSEPPPIPTVNGLDVHNGDPTGGTAVTVTGTGFTPTMKVTFGGVPATNIQYLSTEAAIVVAPPGQGAVDVVVTTAGGSTGPSSADSFYYGNPPDVGEISPAEGDVAGGTQVMIHGDGFRDATSVAFGGVPTQSFTVVSDTEIDAIAPAATGSEVVDVQVVNPAGGSSTSEQDQYTYSVEAVSGIVLTPATATINAGNSLTFAATGIAADGTPLGDITQETTFSIKPSDSQVAGTGASCDGATCTATVAGSYNVTATDGTAIANAVLIVNAAEPAIISSSSGNGQTVATGQPFPDLLSVTVTDSFGNPVSNALVTFTVSTGLANFGGVASTSANTTSTGVAVVSEPLTAGSTPGPVTVAATVEGGTVRTTFSETVSTVQAGRADIAVMATAPSTLTHGSIGSVVVTVTNKGPAVATQVITSVLIPPVFKIIATPNAHQIGSLITFYAGGLASGAHLSYSIAVQDDSPGAKSTWIAVFSFASTKDPTYTNNLQLVPVKLR
jgi:alpha-tubulin suppressor-like RCC1 family protein/protocatechuate 3,4-dioxygenase beta subunit